MPTELKLPITVDQIKTYLKEVADATKVDTIVGGELKDGKIQPKIEQKTDVSPEATQANIAETIHAVLKKILTSSSINVDGVI